MKLMIEDAKQTQPRFAAIPALDFEGSRRVKRGARPRPTGATIGDAITKAKSFVPSEVEEHQRGSDTQRRRDLR